MPSLFRYLTHRALSNLVFQGDVLDLGGSKISEYMKMVQSSAKTVTVLNVDPGTQPDIFADLEKPLPCQDAVYDTVLAMNVLEHVYHYQLVLNESLRVLRAGGDFVIVVPFLFQVHPSPNDYFRYTKQGLSRLLTETGFVEVDIVEIGTGPMAVRYQMLYNFLPEPIRRVWQPFALFWDAALAKLAQILKKPHPAYAYPLGYLVRAKKAF